MLKKEKGQKIEERQGGLLIWIWDAGTLNRKKTGANSIF